jgi:outer membrane protein
MRSLLAVGLLLLSPWPAPAAEPPAPPAAVVTLEEAVRSALARQPQLRQAEASARAADARTDQARAGLRPQVTATAQAERFAPTSGLSDRAATAWSGQLAASQVLYDPVGVKGWRAAQAGAEALRETAGAARLDVISGARAAFFAARAGRDLARVARETVENDRAHLRQVEAFVEIGTQPPIALAKARADLATAQLALIQAENGDASARALLAEAMGLTDWGELAVGDDTLPPVDGEDGPLAPLLAEAQAARPELASLRAQRRSAEDGRATSRAGHLPSVSARAAAGEAGPGLDRLSSSWSAGVALTWSLFDGGLADARVREADAGLEGLAAQEEALRTSIRVALEQARLGVRAARSSVEAAAEAEVSAREQLRLAEGRYQAGAGSILELGDAQVAASTAAAQRVRAGYDLASARAALLRALGRER